MANLINPNKDKHEYIVGIDFGHGETSAAICSIEWDKPAGQRKLDVTDIDVDIAAKKKVITSAICRLKDGHVHIGDEAFEHMTDNNGIRLCFKKKPEDLYGAEEELMIDYMHNIYERILESRDELNKDNHIVYIARPSGWVEENSKELYRQMAIKAGIPLGGLTSESRAAIFYAKSQTDFAQDISKGAIVFDLGSSTLDFTYLSDKGKPIDYGYNLGASIIDETILNDMILSKPEIKEFIGKHPEYYDALKFKARKFKENAYSRNPESKTNGSFCLDEIIPDTEESYDEYSDHHIQVRIKNLAELNEKIDSSVGYIKELEKALDHFKSTKIHKKELYGVFLTGGASRMNFIRPLIAKHLNLSEDRVKRDNDNPSLTISRGISLLGTADVRAIVLVSELKKDISSEIDNNKWIDDLIKDFSSNITREVWEEVKSTCNKWVDDGTTTDIEELKEKLEYDIKIFLSEKLPGIVNNTIKKILEKNGNDIFNKMNNIIQIYAPGQEIVSIKNVNIDNIKAINESLENMSSTISEICNSITNVLEDILWAALGLFLWGIFCLPYYILKGMYNLLRDDKEKREVKVKKIFEKKDEITPKIEEKICENLNNNPDFKNTVKSALNNYFKNLVDDYLQQVKIPIE